MQKTCDVAEKAILAKKKIAEKVRKSIKNGENRQKMVKSDKNGATSV